VEVKTAVQEAAPEAKKATKKEKELTPHQEMQQVIIHAMGWKQENVKEWGQINKASKKLRDTNTSPDMVMGWRTWNNTKFNPMKNPYAILSTWADYMEWREGRTFPSWEQVKADKKRASEPEPETDPSNYISPEEHARGLEMMRQLARKKSMGYDPITDTTSKEREEAAKNG
jgi:hypothetical protein